jgi:acyl dehydratase
MPAEYVVDAYNSSHASENKIHDDRVAQRFGFTGGLVPGVDVYAYMTHPAVERWGLDWLRHGSADVRFVKPVYDGHRAVITARDATGGTLEISVESDGLHCASGTAELPMAQIAPAIGDFAAVSPPQPQARPEACHSTLGVGRRLGMHARVLTADTAAAYCRDVRDELAVYGREGVVHPGWILRACNAVLVDSVVLGPWIHVGSRVQNFDCVHIGEEITARAIVVANTEKKGHQFVDLDVIVVASGERVAARVKHVAIWKLREGGNA